MAYLNVVRVDEALAQLGERFKPFELGTETVSLHNAMYRCLAEDLYAGEHLPAFRRSMVDGYAIVADDSHGASEQAPMVLECVGAVRWASMRQFMSAPAMRFTYRLAEKSPKAQMQ